MKADLSEEMLNAFIDQELSRHVARERARLVA